MFQIIKSSQNNLLAISNSVLSVVTKSLSKKFEYPPLNPNEIVEQVTKGGGPGGQKVNKATNCCQIKHIPTGIFVSSHHTRSLEENRKIARRLLQEKLDYHFNRENSFLYKKQEADRAQKLKRKKRAQENLQRKLKFKEEEGLE